MRTQPLIALAITAAFAAAQPAVAWGMLPRDPASFVIAARDGQHLLVALSSVPVADDTGNDCTLPNGQRVELRKAFPTSGLYDLPSKTPAWTVNLPLSWEGEQRLIRISTDGRYLAHVNLFGDLPQSNWAIRFYDRGTLIKTYSVNDLVDYPSLMDFDTFGWHHRWIDESAYDTDIEGELYHLKTSCREAYTFDVASGKIVSGFRFWRIVSRASIVAALTGAVLIATVLYRRRLRLRRQQPASAAVVDSAATSAIGARRLQFSIRALLASVTGIATLITLGMYWPHRTLFFAVLATTIALTIALRRSRRRGDRSSTAASRTGRGMLTSAVVAGWLLTYALSAPPVLHLIDRWPTDIRMMITQVPYAPLYWLAVNTPLEEWPAVRSYERAWER